MTEQPSDSEFSSHPTLNQLSEIVLAAAHRLGNLQGFPVTDAALVAETDLDVDQVREILQKTLAGGYLDVVPGERPGSVEVVGLVPHGENAPPEGQRPAQQ